MKKTIKTATITAFATIAVLLVIATALTAGFMLLKSPFKNGDSGSFILSVNPEIRIDYDENGKVTSVKGNNKDGKALLEGLDGYVGLSCADVISDLVKEIHAAGYFVDEIDGERRNIVIQIEPGSVIPEKGFVEKIEKEVEGTVKELEVSSEVITIDRDDYDGKYANALTPSKYITLDKAKEIALAHAGVVAADARFDDCELDREGKKAVYEIDFYANGSEYEYDIDAESGKVLDYEWETKKRPSKKDDAPVVPVEPVAPVDPVPPVEPVAPVEPIAPVDPVPPVEPVAPVEPEVPKYITLDEAKAVALADAGVDAADVRFDDCELDKEDGKAVYEISFEVGKYEFEYDINAITGEIFDSEKEVDD